MRKLDKWTARAVLLLTIGAFVLSFEKLYAVAVHAEYPSRLAWIYPVIVEGFTSLCTLAAFLRHGKPGAWYPWTVGLFAFAFSLWANSNPGSVPGEVVRAVPVVAIPLMVHMWLIISGKTDRAPAEPVEQVQAVTLAEPVDVRPIMASVEDYPVTVEPDAAARRRAANFLWMAKQAKSDERRTFWENRAAAEIVA